MKPQFRRLVARQLEKRVKKLLASNEIKVVAVTGSVGKTSTKLAIAHVLRVKYKVLAHEGNYNSEISLPLSIFELDVPKTLVNPLAWAKIIRQIDQKLTKPFPYNVLVLEFGADGPNDIQKFMRYIKPDWAVITAIQPVHVEGFGAFKDIVKEKWALALGSDRVLINAQDATLMAKKASHPKNNIITYGVDEGNYKYSPHNYQMGTGYTGTLVLGSGKHKAVIPVVGRQSLNGPIAAAALAEMMDVPPEDIIKRLASLKAVSGRMNMLAGKNGSFIIDDTYNASPQAVIAALEMLYEVTPHNSIRGVTSYGCKIAILGNMNELGSYMQKGHELVGAKCGKLDMLLTIGDSAGEFIAAAAEKAGLKSDKIHRFNSPYEVGFYLDGLLNEGDVVLAKGSQNGVFAEEAVALLLAKSSDRSKLVRQSKVWYERKKKQFGVE